MAGIYGDMDVYGPTHTDRKLESMKNKIESADIGQYHKWQLLDYLDKLIDLHLESFEKPKQKTYIPGSIRQ